MWHSWSNPNIRFLFSEKNMLQTCVENQTNQDKNNSESSIANILQWKIKIYCLVEKKFKVRHDRVLTSCDLSRLKLLLSVQMTTYNSSACLKLTTFENCAESIENRYKNIYINTYNTFWWKRLLKIAMRWFYKQSAKYLKYSWPVSPDCINSETYQFLFSLNVQWIIQFLSHLYQSWGTTVVLVQICGWCQNPFNVIISHSGMQQDPFSSAKNT